MWITLFGIHHIGFDGWSREVFISELVQIYESLRSGRDPGLPELVVSYTDYAHWQKDWLRDQNLALFTEHWKDILYGELPVLDLHTDRPVQQFKPTRELTISFQPFSCTVIPNGDRFARKNI